MNDSLPAADTADNEPEDFMRNVSFSAVVKLPKVTVEGHSYSSQIEVEIRDEALQPGYAGSLSVDLEPVSQLSELSICGSVRGTGGYESGGQNIEEIATLHPTDARVQRLAAIWRQYHLNGTHAGTRAQTALVHAFLATNPPYPANDYTHQCAALESAGLLVDRGYKYGTEWLSDALPDEIRAEVIALCETAS